MVTVAVMTLIWVPFLIVMDRGYLKEELAKEALAQTGPAIDERIKES